MLSSKVTEKVQALLSSKS